MAVELNHTIVPAADKWASAKFLAAILGLEAGPEWGPFVPIRLANGVTLDEVGARPVDKQQHPQHRQGEHQEIKRRQAKRMGPHQPQGAAEQRRRPGLGPSARGREREPVAGHQRLARPVAQPAGLAQYSGVGP